MDASDVDDYNYPQDTVELIEQPEVEPHVEAQSSEQLEGIQSWLRGEVDLQHAGLGDEAAEQTLFRHVEELEVNVDAEDARAAEARAAAADVQAASMIEPPTYAQELRETATPEGALAEAQSDAAASARLAALESEWTEQAAQTSTPKETIESPEAEVDRERYDGGLRSRL
jgi:hypothetical protein